MEEGLYGDQAVIISDFGIGISDLADFGIRICDFGFYIRTLNLMK